MGAENTQENIAAIIILIVGVSVAALVLIFVSVLGGQTFNLVESDIDDVGVTDVTGESFAASNLTWTTLNSNPIISGSYTIYNNTGSTNTSDFTVNITDGTLLVAAGGDQTLNGTTCTVTYEYGDATIRGRITDGIASTFLALKQSGQYLPIVVMAIIIVLILGLIVGLTGGFGFNKYGPGGDLAL